MAGDAAASAEGRDRRVGFLTASREEHPILANFSPDDLFGLKQIRVSRYMLLEPTPSSGGRTVLSLDDGSPILLTKTVEKGRVGLLATSLDRDWTDLPIRVHFLPILVQTVRYLARTQAMDSSTHLVGEKVVLKPSAASIERVQIEAPDGTLHTQSKPTNPTEAWVFKDTNRLGHYHVRPDPPMANSEEMAGFAVALDTQASNLGAYKPKGDVDNPDQSNASQAGKEPPVELWHMGLALLFLLLLAEAGLIYGRQGDAPFTDRGESSSEAITQSPSV